MGSLQGDDFLLQDKRIPNTTKLKGEKISMPSTEMCIIDDNPLHSQVMEIDSQPVSIAEETQKESRRDYVGRENLTEEERTLIERFLDGRPIDRFV